MKTTTKTVSRIRVTDACSTVRARKRELARPDAYNVTRTRALVRLSVAMERLYAALVACPEHNEPLCLR
jgi:hypothetical protein